MKTTSILGVVLLAFSTAGLAQTTQNGNANALSNSNSQSQTQASAATGNVNITQNSEAHKHSSVDTTPTLYAPPSMFGGQNNCGQSDTLAVGITGFGIGGSHASESLDCNAREDTGIAYKLGYKDVANLRFFCFGTDLNRKAYEAAGHKCPEGSTAKGLEGAPTTAMGFKQTNENVAVNQVNPASLDEDDRTVREQSNYWGNDPIVMNRLGIKH